MSYTIIQQVYYYVGHVTHVYGDCETMQGAELLAAECRTVKGNSFIRTIRKPAY